MKEYTITNDPVLQAIVEELISLYQCHTIILYGSRARGDFTASSDYSDRTTAAERFFEQKPKDLFEYLLERIPYPARPAMKRIKIPA